MTFLLDHSPSGRSRIAALLAAVLAAAGLLLGAASAQANPSDPAPDFLMKVGAASASFTPVAGKPGEYRLVLRGVPSKVKVTELTNAKTSASLPINAFMAYWTVYGDKTGQFKTTPPRVVLQGVDAAGGKKVMVRLRDASRTGTTLKFNAQVITRPAESEQLGAKIDKVDDTPQVGDPVLKPTAMTEIEMFVDMPSTPRIQPKTKSAAFAADATPSSRKAQTMTCNRVTSNRLRLCWPNIQSWGRYGSGTINCSNGSGSGGRFTGFQDFVNRRGFAYDNVGVVDLGSYFWNPGQRPRGLSRDRCFRYWKWGNWYGVHRDWRTFYTVYRCNWFMAAWAPSGPCW